MAGGTWKAQNKRRPGAYINVRGNGNQSTEDATGRLLMFQNMPLGWGENGVITLDASSDFEAKTGHKLSDPELAPVKEALKGAETVLLVKNEEGGKKALCDLSTDEYGNHPLTIEAKYAGTVGNNITVNVTSEQADINDVNKGYNTKITTILGTRIVDEQTIIAPYWMRSNYNAAEMGIKSLDDLEIENKYIKFKYTDEIKKAFLDTQKSDQFTPPDGKDIAAAFSIYAGGEHSYQLKGGVNGTSNFDNMDKVLENEFYAVATTAGWKNDSNIHQLFAEEIKRLRENLGIKVRGVVPNYEDKKYNYEGISSVKNGYKQNDGTIVDVSIATARFAGMSASANEGTALTYSVIDDAVDAYPSLDNEETINALNAGQIVFTRRPGDRVVIEQDINSLTTFTSEKPKEFSKNRVIRTLDTIADDTSQTFENSFLGKVSNNDYGRDLFKANRVSFLQNLQDNNVIQKFSPNDITVKPGNDSDSILVNLSVTPVDAMEKLYMTIVVE